MPGSRRLSQRIAEGDGIAIIARVADAEAARRAEEQGAKALAVEATVAGIREATSLPLLWLGSGRPLDADAVAVGPAGDGGGAAEEVETVTLVRDEEELEQALEGHDPEIFLLAAPSGDAEHDPLASVLELLPDLPAGKLAIAGIDAVDREEVDALERAGFDAVLAAGEIAGLVGAPPPDV